jgi:hypothetical protein
MMSLFDFDWDKPEHVNELGVKFWLDKSTTEFAQKEDQFGTKLDGWQVLIVEEPSGYRTRIITDDKQNIKADDQTLEGIGVKIDIFKLLKRHDIRDND